MFWFVSASCGTQQNTFRKHFFYENTWLGNISHFKVICEPRMSGLVSKPCYRNRKSILCHNGTKAILFKHAVFKQSTHGKADFVIGS